MTDVQVYVRIFTGDDSDDPVFSMGPMPTNLLVEHQARLISDPRVTTVTIKLIDGGRVILAKSDESPAEPTVTEDEVLETCAPLPLNAQCAIEGCTARGLGISREIVLLHNFAAHEAELLCQKRRW